MADEIWFTADQAAEGREAPEVTAIATLILLIRLSINLAAGQKLVETEHELRRALLGLHLAAPEAAAAAHALTNHMRPN